MVSYYDRLAQIESSNNPNARSKTSSASGLFQMTRPTFDWLRTSNPKFAQITWEQHNNDPTIQKLFAEELTNRNASQLQKSGLPVNELTKYLSHFAGASGAQKLLTANPATKVRDLLGDKVAQANKSLIGANTTVAQLMQNFSKKLGMNLPQSHQAMMQQQAQQAPMNMATAAAPINRANDLGALNQLSQRDLLNLINRGQLSHSALTPTANQILAQRTAAPTLLANAPAMQQPATFAAGGVAKLPTLDEINAGLMRAASSAAASPGGTSDRLPTLDEINAGLTKPEQPASANQAEKTKDKAKEKPKEKGFFSKAFEGAAKALGTRPEQVSGNAISGFKVREKTAEEEKKGPTRLQDRARMWAGIGQGGVIDPVLAVTQLVAPKGGAVDNAINAQLEGYSDFNKALGNTGFDASRLAGNVLSPIGIKGANLVDKAMNKAGTGLFKRGAVQGLVATGMQPVLGDDQNNFWGEKASQAATNALLGGSLLKLFGRVPSGAIDDLKTSAVAKFKSEFPEADLTWGQHLGKTANDLEQKLTSFPWLGDVIKRARNRSLLSANEAMMQRALDPADIKLQKTPGDLAGTNRPMFEQAYRKLGDKYDEVLNRLKLEDSPTLRGKIYGTLDTGTGKSLATPEQLMDSYKPGSITKQYNQLSEKAQQKFDRLLEENLFKRFRKDPDGNNALPITGQQFKGIEEDIRKAVGYLTGGSSTSEDRIIADMLKDALDTARKQLTGSADDVKLLSGLNKAYAGYKTLAKASTASGASKGYFTPTQVINAAKARGQNNVATGKGLLQPEAELSEEVLGRAYGDPGSPGRLLSASPSHQVIGAVLSPIADVLYSPKVASTILEGGTRAKRAFQRTKLGEALANRSVVPGFIRGLSAPSEPEEKKRHGGYINRYAAGGPTFNPSPETGFDLANSYLTNKLLTNQAAQAGIPMQPMSPEQQQQLQQSPMSQLLQAQQNQAQGQGSQLVDQAQGRPSPISPMQGMQAIPMQVSQQPPQAMNHGGMVHPSHRYAAGSLVDTQSGTDALMKLFGRNKSASSNSASATGDSSSGLSATELHELANDAGAYTSNAGASQARAPAAQPIVAQGNSELTDLYGLPYGLSPNELPYGAKEGQWAYGASAKSAPYARDKSKKKTKDKEERASKKKSSTLAEYLALLEG